MTAIDYESFQCHEHGFDIPILRPSEAEARGLPVGCPECTDEMMARPVPAEMTGEQRAAEVRALLTRPTTVSFQMIHERIASLVGRDVWTHEMVNPEILAQEALDWQAPADLMGHLIGTLRDAIGDKPIIIVRPEDVAT